MDNSIYEVSRDEYVGFVSQLNKEMCEYEQAYQEDLLIIKIKSKNTGVHFCTRIVPKEGDAHYFIFNMPLDKERIAPKPVRKIILDTKEDVKTFFETLNEAIQEAKENAGDIQ